MPDEELANLTTRITADTMRRLKIEAASTEMSVRELVQLAIEDLLERRAEDRRDDNAFGRCGQ